MIACSSCRPLPGLSFRRLVVWPGMARAPGVRLPYCCIARCRLVVCCMSGCMLSGCIFAALLYACMVVMSDVRRQTFACQKVVLPMLFLSLSQEVGSRSVWLFTSILYCQMSEGCFIACQKARHCIVCFIRRPDGQGQQTVRLHQSRHSSSVVRRSVISPSLIGTPACSRRTFVHRDNR
jgi:hypothetical protein